MAAAAVAGVGGGAPLRWQIKRTAVLLALDALAAAARHSATGGPSSHFDVAAARAAVEAALDQYTAGAAAGAAPDGSEGFGAFGGHETGRQARGGLGEGGGLGALAASPASPASPRSVGFDDAAAFEALPDFAACHLDALLATACSAATFTLGDDHGVASLQVSS